MASKGNIVRCLYCNASAPMVRFPCELPGKHPKFFFKMDVAFSSPQVLHLSVAPGVKSWSIFVGVISVGVGAAYYSPDDHLLLKIAYLTGCLILGLTFLDDWEDCVFDKVSGMVTLTRRSWWERLTSSCAHHNTLQLDTGTVMAVRVAPVNTRVSEGYQLVLVLRAGGTVPVAETKMGCKSIQEHLSKRVQTFLCLDRVETITTATTWGDWTESDDDLDDDYLFLDQPPIQVESLKGRGNLNFDEVKIENENNIVRNAENDAYSSSEDDEPFDNLYAE